MAGGIFFRLTSQIFTISSQRNDNIYQKLSYSHWKRKQAASAIFLFNPSLMAMAQNHGHLDVYSFLLERNVKLHKLYNKA